MNKVQEDIKDKIVDRIKDLGEEIRNSGLPIKDQLTQMDVVLDTIRFLEHYDRDTKILNQNLRERRER